MAWQKDAERELSREAERLEEKGQRIGGLMKVLEDVPAGKAYL